MQTHKDLKVWQKSIEFVEYIYTITNDFPKEELYGLTSQMRRCAVSVPSNIAEGSARNHNKEFIQFLYVSLGSLSELETQLIIAVKIGYLSEFNEQEMHEIRKMLQGLILNIKRKFNE
ncbi:MAG: four helix bundle protein [Deltaproteobacteria bacterium HGW-Deltaproteobacteria-24]|nr:MAG: four helix bundle protein [Deltaproteobacteria bacterium HGW-Deltaproteobacteria-24]